MTTKPKFTPGPWLAAESDTHDKRQAIWADGGLVGCAQVAILPPEFPRTKANAALIAAAPEMYESEMSNLAILAALLVRLEGHASAQVITDIRARIAATEAALAKAEGRS